MRGRKVAPILLWKKEKVVEIGPEAPLPQDRLVRRMNRGLVKIAI
jgi:hypothetical protein